MFLIKRFSLHITALLCFLPAVFQPDAAAAGSESKRAAIVIGALASLTGPAAEQGQNWLEGAILAAEELKNEGGEVSLRVEDDQTIPARVPGILRKLAAIDRVQAVIGGTWDFLSEAAHPVAKQLKIPFVTPSNPAEIIDAAAGDNPYVFTNGLSLQATERAMRGFLKKYKPAAASIIVPNVPFGVMHGDMLEKLAAELGIRILSRENFEYAGYQETLRALALKLSRGGKPELVFCLSDYSAIDVFAAQLERQHFFPLLLTTQHLDQALALSGRPARYERAFGIYPRIDDPGFAARFAARFGHKPRVYSANGYDAVKFLTAALRAGADISRAEFEYRGILGLYRARAGTRALLLEDQAVIMAVKAGALVECPECIA